MPDHAVDVTGRLRFAEALGRLPDRDREVMLLHVWEDLEPREIAEVLGISGVATRARLSRARARLRQLVDDDSDGFGHRDRHDVRPAGHIPSTTPDLVPEEGR